MNQQQALLNEIRQIATQYKDEVPKGRTAWPNSIKQRVIELRGLGMSYKSISDQTGVPYFTVLNWRDSTGNFKEVVTVTVPSQQIAHESSSTGTVTVTTPSGFRIDGLSLGQLMSILERLK